jgi:hypothetical protein
MANRMVQALDDIETDIEDLTHFISTYIAGVESVKNDRDMTELILSITRAPERRAKMEAELAALAPALAKAEGLKKSGYEYLFGIAVVRLWTALEAAMNDVCRARLELDGYWRKANSLEGVMADLGKFLARSDRDQVSFVLEEITKKSGARGQPGVGRFQNLLKELALGGGIARPIRKRILWLSEARHVLVHRQGQVDQKFLDAYPGTGKQPGDKLVVREHEFARSVAAVHAYVDNVGMRLEKAGLAEERPERATRYAQLVASMVEHDAAVGDA